MCMLTKVVVLLEFHQYQQQQQRQAVWQSLVISFFLLNLNLAFEASRYRMMNE